MEDQSRTNLNGGELVRSTFVVLTLARALAFVTSFILVFVFAFLSPFGSEIFAFLLCNGEKRYLEPVLNHPLWGLWPGLCPCPWRFVEEGYLSSVQ